MLHQAGLEFCPCQQHSGVRRPRQDQVPPRVEEDRRLQRRESGSRSAGAVLAMRSMALAVPLCEAAQPSTSGIPRGNEPSVPVSPGARPPAPVGVQVVAGQIQSPRLRRPRDHSRKRSPGAFVLPASRQSHHRLTKPRGRRVAGRVDPRGTDRPRRRRGQAGRPPRVPGARPGLPRGWERGTVGGPWRAPRRRGAAAVARVQVPRAQRP